VELGLHGLGPESPLSPSAGVVLGMGSTAPPAIPHIGVRAVGVLGVATSNHQSRVSGSLRPSSPQVIQCALLPRCGKVFPARLVVNQVDDDVPHDRTPLFDPWVLIPVIRFPVSSRDHENGFVSATEWFRGLCTMKQLHGFAISAIRTLALLAHGAKHNAAKRNMIAWRRCVSMLDAQIPSKALSAEVVPRFDATQR